MYGLKIEALEEIGANWHNIVLDIDEYLNAKNFQYSRTLGFVNDRELSKEEVLEIGRDVADIALGIDNFLYFNAMVIGDTKSLK